MAYFVFVGAALAVGEGDIAAGEGLAAGLGLVAGAVVSPAGVVAGAAAAGDEAGVAEFELVAGSHAAANAITRIVVNRSAVRLIDFRIGLLIVFPHSDRIEKRDDDCPNAKCQQWVFPQALRRGLPLSSTEALVLNRVPATNGRFVQPARLGQIEPGPTRAPGGYPAVAPVDLAGSDTSLTTSPATVFFA